MSGYKQREREWDREKERVGERERESVNTFSFLIHSEAAGKRSIEVAKNRARVKNKSNKTTEREVSFPGKLLVVFSR